MASRCGVRWGGGVGGACEREEANQLPLNKATHRTSPPQLGPRGRTRKRSRRR